VLLALLASSQPAASGTAYSILGRTVDILAMLDSLIAAGSDAAQDEPVIGCLMHQQAGPSGQC
jgi:hypothetical protein